VRPVWTKRRARAVRSAAGTRSILDPGKIDLKALDREDQLLWRDISIDVPGATEEVEEGARRPAC
jgi:hypothetical protein